MKYIVKGTFHEGACICNNLWQCSQNTVGNCPNLHTCGQHRPR